MKKNVWMLLSILLLCSCGGQSQKEKKNEEKQESATTKNVKEMTFDQLFKSISPEEISENIFKLVGKDFTVITAGDESHYNSMTASFGGVGILFGKPATWCFLRANRYTLEVIKDRHVYTMSYFADEYKEQVLFFGSKSGRDSDKMKETTLTPVRTPLGNMAYKEAKLIIECKLTELTTVSPGDFYTQEGREFVEGAFEEAKDYHKLVFGEITNVWVNK